MVEAIGVPFDLCGYQLGSRLGPEALELAGIGSALEQLTIPFRWREKLQVQSAPQTGSGLQQFAALIEIVGKVKTATSAILSDGNLPLVVGGDHSISMGSIGAALNHYGDKLAVLWIDAHVDVNTPQSSPSGNVHGMPIAALAGSDSHLDPDTDAHWNALLQLIGPIRLQFGRVAWLGIRDLDSGERARLRELKGISLASSMSDIDRYGLLWELRRLDAWLKESGATHLWISFDVDVMDPQLAPGTGTSVMGGLTYREAHLVAEVLHEFLSTPSCPYQLAGLDVVEINPIIDTHNATAKMAVEWVGSLFGKAILELE